MKTLVMVLVLAFLGILVSENVGQAYAEYAYFGNGTLTHVGPVLDEYHSVGDSLKINLFYPDTYVTPNNGFYSGISFGFEIIDPHLDAFSDECNVSVTNDADPSGYDVINIFCANPPFNPGSIGSATYDEFILSFIDEDGIALSSTALPENLSQLDPFWESASMTLTYDAMYMGFPIKTHLIGEFSFPLDSDGDGIIDEWEMHGLDYDLDGIIDIDFPGKGADYRHKDLFLEIDYMENHKPSNNVISMVTNSFANAPNSLVSNPDGQDGINLHIEVDEQIPHQANVTMWTEFDSLKNSYFGSPSERSSETEKIKKYFYRYGMFIHTMGGSLYGPSGISELPGNDFVASLGTFAQVDGHRKGTDIEQAGTLMHEFGHSLGLRHGGQDNVNCKPNYLSIMSYSFQTDMWVPSRPLDYSREKNPTIDENNLDETLGIQGPSSNRVTVIGSENATHKNQLYASTAYDFDMNGNATDTGVSRDVNHLGFGCNGSGDMLVGASDWDKILYDFRGTADFFGDGIHPEFSDDIAEMTKEQIDAVAASIVFISCQPPTSGDWMISQNCEMSSSENANGSVVVTNGAVLTIPSGISLTIPSGENITIQPGGGVLIKNGGTLQINS